ncbi:MAG: toll/interleukin-1 receptor domain-containing protein, partial [Anaerolineae bacterium]|nr:toll/interleukin-1 receptor domain-containing protein [Anaerolineae bacterium]
PDGTGCQGISWRASMMDNPLEQSAPKDPLDRVHAFAYDLAWGVAHGMWGTELNLVNSRNNPFYRIISPAKIFDVPSRDSFVKKWGDNRPGADLMLSFMYANSVGRNGNLIDSSFVLSPKALMLLEKPAIPPKIFISYRQKESSAFASLIEARLTLADPTIGVFIDKQIEGGAKWLKRIEKEVRHCEHFIIVYGPDTPNSGTIPLEIAWAEETESNIIPVLHNKFTRKCAGYPEQFKELNDITVEKESAKAYENAITEILIALGYPTLQSPRTHTTRR